ncbi:MAG: molybdate ABC transporter permease subunit [Methanosarcinales archaeon]|nr:molybdate ABC transporter permease subunit [Methanosarcinales archaeon]
MAPLQFNVDFIRKPGQGHSLKRRDHHRPAISRKALLKLCLSAVLLLVTLFLVLPVASLLLKVSPGVFLQSLRDPVVMDALSLSLATSAVTTITVILFGTPVAYVNARFHYPGKEIIDSFIDLPVIMPPAVAGIALLMAFGRMGVLGQHLNALGFNVAFTTLAVIIAQIFVSAPFFMRQARTSFEDVDRIYECAARTLGATDTYTFFHVTLPIAQNGLISGAIMTFARSLGEFGATIMFAGNFQGRTQTMPLAIYTAMQWDLDVSLCLALILVAFSFLVIALVRIFMSRMKEHA